MHALKISDDVLMFVVGLAAWAAYGVWGWHVAGGPWRWVLAIGLPLVVVAAWAFLAAPTSGTRLQDPALAVFQLAVFLVGAGLLVAAGRPVWGGVLAALALVVVVLDRTLLTDATSPWGPAG